MERREDMDNFIIISDAEKDIGHETAEDIKRYLESYGKCARIVGDLAQIGGEIRTDMAIVLGGDGSADSRCKLWHARVSDRCGKTPHSSGVR